MSDISAPNATLRPQSFQEDGPHAGQSGSTKVGWTLRTATNRIITGVAFNINPQGLNRVESSRAQLYATKGSFYVNDFGPGPPSITLRQLVGSGKSIVDRTGNVVELLTQRQDVLRFLNDIWSPAVTPQRGKEPYRVFFHDNHLERGHEEEVYFPPQGFSLQRSVDLQNVWLVEIQMTGLDPHALADIAPADPAIRTGVKRYVVRASDTLHRIVVRVAGKHADRARRKQVLSRLLELNPQIKHKRTLQVGATNFAGSKDVTVLAMHVAPGEILTLP